LLRIVEISPPIAFGSLKRDERSMQFEQQTSMPMLGFFESEDWRHRL
jgi:hypothetical protein